MKKLKTILNESLSFQQNKVYSNPFAKAFVSEIENDENGNSLSIEEKKQFLESVKMYRELGERIGYRGNLAEVHKMLKSIVEMASRVTIDETEDWFDRVTVNRHIKALNEAFKLFTKTVQEIYPLQQRLESTYDEMGEVLSKYYEIKNIDINNLTTESKNMKFTQLVEQEKEYKEFFKSALKKFGIKSPADLDTEKKKEFFTYVDDNWKAKTENITEGDFAGWVAIFNGKRIEIDKSEAKDLWGAKQLAIKRLNVPKSKVGLLAIKPGYNENTVHMNEGVVKKLGKYTFDSRDYPQVKYNGEVITTGEFDEDGYWFDIPGKRGSTWFDSAEDVLNYLSKNKITFESVMNEIKSGSIVTINYPTLKKPIKSKVVRVLNDKNGLLYVMKDGSVWDAKYISTNESMKLTDMIKKPSVNEIKSGSIVIPYAHDRYGEFTVDKVFKNKDGETSYTGKFKKSGENREFILHSKDKIIKENTNMKLTNLLKENFGMGELPSSKLMKMKQSLSEIMAESDSKADLLRTNMPGYVGPKFAKKASDDDLLKMADLKDKLAKLHNQHTKPVEDEIAKLQKKYNIKESVNENKKKIKINPPIGNAKYSISYYDGKKTHKDGSPFYDIKIFKSKDELNTAIGDFKKQGYIEESVNENKSDAMYDLAAQVYDLVDYKDLKNKNKIKAALAKLKKPTDPLTIGMVMRKMQDVIGENTINEGKFSVDDLVYNKRTKTVGIVRIGDDKYGEVKTDADGNVSVDELEKYNPIKFKHQSKAKVAPSTEKEINSRGLFNPFKSESVNESKVHFEKKLKNGNIFQVIDRDTAGMRGTQDKFHMQIVDKTGKVVKDVGSHPSLDGAKKFSNKFESVNEYNVNKKFGPKYDIGAGSLGNGTTFWNRAEEEFGDYKKIAHVSDNGKITFYDKKLPNDVKSHIEKYADMQTESVNPMSLTSLISKNKK